MLANNKWKFSRYEIIAIAQQINKNLNLKVTSVKTILNILASHGITDIVAKYSKSTRHLYWFVKPLCLQTFKVINNV